MAVILVNDVTLKMITIFHYELQNADMAICDLTITYMRRSAVDFSAPFMTLGNFSIVI